MKEVTINECKEIQLDMLKYLDDVCKKNNINYSLCGGTLIGAIRHKGFIPWDDDIDVVFLREDYEKLIRVLDDNATEYMLLTLKDENYYFPFCKLVDKKTILIENDLPRIPQLGIFIDIYPVDNIPDNFILREIQKIKHKMLDSILWKTINSKNYRDKTIKKYLYKMDRNMKKYQYKNSNTAGCLVGRYGSKEIMDRNLFEGYTKIQFEKYEFSCFKEYDRYLKNIYGDYMKMPPKEQQVSNHDFKVYWR